MEVEISSGRPQKLIRGQVRTLFVGRRPPGGPGCLWSCASPFNSYTCDLHGRVTSGLAAAKGNITANLWTDLRGALREREPDRMKALLLYELSTRGAASEACCICSSGSSGGLSRHVESRVKGCRRSRRAAAQASTSLESAHGPCDQQDPNLGGAR